MEIETTTTAGVAERFRLTDDTLEITRGAGPCRSYSLSSVTRVQLASLGEMRVCELGMTDGSKTAISAAKPTAAFGSFVALLHGKLVAQSRPVVYVRGSWLLVGLLAAIGVLAMLLALSVHLGWLDMLGLTPGQALRIMFGGLLWTLIGPAIVWGSRPRAYDPSNTEPLTR